MDGSKDNIAVFIRKFLEEHEIDPFYAVTVFGILITLSYWNYFKNWENLQTWRKSIIGTTTFGAIIFVIISVLRIVGIFKL